jgi:glycosyltransferase involved in cell wall biosynthesis
VGKEDQLSAQQQGGAPSSRRAHIEPEPTHSDVTSRVSVVIPTMNEEGWLPHLLEVLHTYTEVTEIVVADNHSDDRTVEISQTAGCIVTSGGRPGPGRNSGARECTNDLILFLDADTIIPRQSLVDALTLFSADASLSAVSFRIVPVGERVFPRIGYAIADGYFRICARAGLHQGLGNAIMVRASEFAAVGGFDESIAVGEDVDVIRRMGRRGRVVYLSSSVALTSERRFRAENNIRFVSKVILWTVVRLLGLRRSPIAYTWTTYPRAWSVPDARDFKRALIEMGQLR